MVIWRSDLKKSNATHRPITYLFVSPSLHVFRWSSWLSATYMPPTLLEFSDCPGFARERMMFIWSCFVGRQWFVFGTDFPPGANVWVKFE